MSKNIVDEFVSGLKKVDLNHNGVPDYEDPAFFIGLLKLISAGVIQLSPGHPTIAKTWAEKVSDITREFPVQP